MQAEREKWSMTTSVCGMFYVVSHFKFDCDSCIALNFQEPSDCKLHSCVVRNMNYVSIKPSQRKN